MLTLCNIQTWVKVAYRTIKFSMRSLPLVGVEQDGSPNGAQRTSTYAMSSERTSGYTGRRATVALVNNFNPINATEQWAGRSRKNHLHGGRALEFHEPKR